MQSVPPHHWIYLQDSKQSCQRVIYTRDGCGRHLLYSLWFYFHGKGPTNANTTTTILSPIAPCVWSFLGWLFMPMWHHYRVLRPRSGVPGERGDHFNTIIQSKAKKDINHINLFSSPRPKPMIDCDLDDRRYRQPQGFAHYECEWENDSCGWF